MCHIQAAKQVWSFFSKILTWVGYMEDLCCLSSRTPNLSFANTGGSHLSQIFWEHENTTVWLKHNLAYPIIIISLIIKGILAKKSGLSGNLA